VDATPTRVEAFKRKIYVWKALESDVDAVDCSRDVKVRLFTAAEPFFVRRTKLRLERLAMSTPVGRTLVRAPLDVARWSAVWLRLS
jgi:hypothetical protein